MAAPRQVQSGNDLPICSAISLLLKTNLTRRDGRPIALLTEAGAVRALPSKPMGTVYACSPRSNEASKWPDKVQEDRPCCFIHSSVHRGSKNNDSWVTSRASRMQ